MGLPCPGRIKGFGSILPPGWTSMLWVGAYAPLTHTKLESGAITLKSCNVAQVSIGEIITEPDIKRKWTQWLGNLANEMFHGFLVTSRYLLTCTLSYRPRLTLALPIDTPTTDCRRCDATTDVHIRSRVCSVLLNRCYVTERSIERKRVYPGTCVNRGGGGVGSAGVTLRVTCLTCLTIDLSQVMTCEECWDVFTSSCVSLTFLFVDNR